jgi:hypothetical protein
LLFLGLGALVLLVLTLPGVLGTLWFAGRMFLPYQTIAYGQEIVSWLSTALRVLSDSAWLLVRFAATNPTVQTSLVVGTIAGAASVLWMRIVFRSRAPQRRASR